jgi:hypothetical protein
MRRKVNVVFSIIGNLLQILAASVMEFILIDLVQVKHLQMFPRQIVDLAVLDQFYFILKHGNVANLMFISI